MDGDSVLWYFQGILGGIGRRRDYRADDNDGGAFAGSNYNCVHFAIDNYNRLDYNYGKEAQRAPFQIHGIGTHARVETGLANPKQI